MDYEPVVSAKVESRRTYQKGLYADGIERKKKKAEYYKANRERINNKKKEYIDKQIHEGSYFQKHKCDCGGQYIQKNISTHENTKKHKKWKAGEEAVRKTYYVLNSK